MVGIPRVVEKLHTQDGRYTQSVYQAIYHPMYTRVYTRLYTTLCTPGYTMVYTTVRTPGYTVTTILGAGQQHPGLKTGISPGGRLPGALGLSDV